MWLFALWASAGAALCLAVLAAPTIGAFVLPVAVAALVALLAWQRSRNHSAAGLLAGAGTLLFYVAYLNRGGPGTVCTTSASSTECMDEFSPWPWLAAGLLLVAGATCVFLLLHRASRTRYPPARGQRYWGAG
jgi:hypothetical protein